MEDVDMALMEYMRCQGKSYNDISERLQTAYPNNHGFSARSVRWYCVLHGISKMSDSEVNDIIGDAVQEVGCIYGRRMMKGYLESKSILVGESKVSISLQRVPPNHYASRRSRTMDRTNPRPYFA
uniref:Uncharacterized protein n=1 Tax=Amphimedon queenslandica TaxID=400682 RepID=A0A1X7VGM6_AMPQE